MALLGILYLVTLLSLPGHTDEALSLAILHLKSDHRYADLCVVYNPLYSTLPHEIQNTPRYRVVMADSEDGCQGQASGESLDSAAFFFTSGGNCTFYEKLQLAYKSHAKQVILISDNKDSDDFPAGTTVQHKDVDLSVAKIAAASWNYVVKSIGRPQYSQLYSPPEPPFDPNLVFLWLIAVFTVVTGSYWSGETLQTSSDSSTLCEEDEDDEGYELPTISPIMILVFIIMVVIVLLLLYYFYSFLIYLVIAIFAITSVSGSYVCLSGITTLWCHVHWRLPENNIPLLKSRPRVINIALCILCLGLSIFWVIIRNDDYAWVLQDFLGVCLCITFLKYFCMPNLKISALLLLAMLLYDIFFVFITPLFSAQSTSIMIQVATGEGGPESIPMVLKIPKMIRTALVLCDRPYSLIGLGDIVLPGVFVSFCHSFDETARTRYRVYWITSSIAYAYGLFMAFFVMVITGSGQPALLYLSPSLLIGVTVVGAYRRELQELWTGEIDMDKRNIQPGSSQQDTQEDECNKGFQKDEEECLVTN